MPSEETKEVVATTSKRGQPIEPEVLAEAKSIASDTKDDNYDKKSSVGSGVV